MSLHVRPSIGLLIAVCLGVGLTACTKAPVPGSSADQTNSSTASSQTSAVPSETTGAPSGSATATASVSATTSATSPRPTLTASTSAITSSAAPSTTCGSSELAVTVERGSGVTGHQYALLRFTNSGRRTCTLSGYPAVQLLLGGKPLGKPAVASGKTAGQVSLKPGRSAVAQLVNDSTCNADNSDAVQVTPPGTSTAVMQPLRFRGCPMTVDPVSAG